MLTLNAVLLKLLKRKIYYKISKDVKTMEKLSVRPLSAELAEKARLELNENPETIFDELEALRSWLSKQPHINARKGSFKYVY